jgi:hypothetical protein
MVAVYLLLSSGVFEHKSSSIAFLDYLNFGPPTKNDVFLSALPAFLSDICKRRPSSEEVKIHV